MQAVILAAGNSSRLYPYTVNQHKSELVICGKMLIEHALDSLEKNGIDSIVIVISPKSSLQEKLENKFRNIKIIYIVQEEALGMGNALLACKDVLEKEFFVLSGYHVNAGDFVHVLIKKQRKKEDVVLLAKKSEVADHYGNIVLHNDQVVSIKEKPAKEEQTAFRLVSIYLLNQSFIQTLTDTTMHDYQFEQALDAYVTRQEVSVVLTDKPTVSLKYAWDILSVKDYLLSTFTKSHVAKSARVSKNVILQGNVVIDEGATVYEGVVIKGPCYIGKNAVVGNNAMLRGGVSVEEGGVVGSALEAKNTLFMQKCTTHLGFIGDSIIGEETKIAGYICTANARLDRGPVKTIVKGEKIDTHIRHLGALIGNKANLGIHVSTMPGIIVGNNVIVGPSTTVMKNIPDNTKYYTKFAEVIEEIKE